MGVRFRKRFRLAPGIHLNLSGGGLSLSAGPRGASMTFGGRGTYLNTGIPGTGLYSRERIDGAQTDYPSRTASRDTAKISVTVTVEDDGTVVFRDSAGNPIDEGMIRKVKEQAKDTIRNLLQSTCDKINGHIEAIEQVHLATPSPEDHPIYNIRPYDVPVPIKPFPKRHGILGFLLKSVRTRIDQENAAALASHEAVMWEWGQQKRQHESQEIEHKMLVEQQVLTNVSAMEIVIEESLKDIMWPRETVVSTEVRDDGRVVMVDVDLPEIDEIPKKTATVPQRGYKLSIKELPITRLQQLYMRHVHAVGFRIVGEVFSVLPKSEVVILSGYSQRPNKGTGVIEDEYLFSVRVKRQDWSCINFTNLAALDVVEAIGRFDIHRDITKSGLFKAISPFEGA